MPAPSRSDLEKAARQFFDRLVEEMDRPRDFPEDDWENQINYQVELSREQMLELDRQLVKKLFDRKIEFSAASVVQQSGIDLDALAP